MIQITTDSTCDLGNEAQKRGIGIVPLSVILGADSFRDGIEITPQDIFRHVEKTGELPKTAAPNVSDYETCFARYVDEGKTVIHYNISAKASSSYANAAEAGRKFGDKVYVVDSKALSSGQGLLVLKAADLRDEGRAAKEIYETTAAMTPRINTSFVPDSLEYLYKGGRCSRLMMYGANLLRIHPLIEMKGGQLMAEKKYRGSMEKCISSYIDDLKVQYPKYDRTRAFITHSTADESLVAFAKKKVAEAFLFDEVIETIAGSVITGHCGRNTLGVLFITEE